MSIFYQGEFSHENLGETNENLGETKNRRRDEDTS